MLNYTHNTRRGHRLHQTVCWVFSSDFVKKQTFYSPFYLGPVGPIKNKPQVSIAGVAIVLKQLQWKLKVLVVQIMLKLGFGKVFQCLLWIFEVYGRFDTYYTGKQTPQHGCCPTPNMLGGEGLYLELEGNEWNGTNGDDLDSSIDSWTKLDGVGIFWKGG